MGSSRFSVHGSRFTNRSSRFTVHDSQFTENRETTMRKSSDTGVPMSPKYLVVVTQVPWCDNSNSW